jgi:hypothetical protein
MEKLLETICFKSILMFLMVCQLLDGLLTFGGLTLLNHRLDFEGNILVRCVLKYCGVIEGLILVKAIGILIIYLVILNLDLIITSIPKARFNLFKILSLIILSIYVLYAIIPWLLLLTFDW